MAELGGKDLTKDERQVSTSGTLNSNPLKYISPQDYKLVPPLWKYAWRFLKN
jgi:hypothetical protein